MTSTVFKQKSHTPCKSALIIVHLAINLKAEYCNDYILKIKFAYFCKMYKFSVKARATDTTQGSVGFSKNENGLVCL